MIRIQKKNTSFQDIVLGRQSDGKYIVWGVPLSEYDIHIRKGRARLASFRVLCAFLCAIGCIGLFIWFVSDTRQFERIFSANFWFGNNPSITTTWVYSALLFFLYGIYRMIVLNHEPKKIMYHTYGQQQQITCEYGNFQLETVHKKNVFAVFNTQHSDIIDIADYMPAVIISAIEEAYLLAAKHGASSVTMYHLLYVLMDTQTMQSMFFRFGLRPQELKDVLTSSFDKGVEAYPNTDVSLEKTLFCAYEIALKYNENYIHETSLFLAIYQQSNVLQNILLDIGIDIQKITNVIAWLRVRTQLREQHRALMKAGARRSKYGIDRAMTAVATPYLNAYSEDITLAAKYGALYPCVAREKELHDVFRVIDAGRQSVLLVGAHGVGKKTIIDGIAERMIAEKVPVRLSDKRLVQVSISKLLAGTTVSGAQERLIRMLDECARAGNVILFFDQLHHLIGGADGSTTFDVSGTLVEYLRTGTFLTISTTTPQEYQRLIANGPLNTVFTKIDIPEMEPDQAIQALESKIGEIEYKQDVFFSYDALEQSVKLAQRFFHETPLPESALTLVTEAAAMLKNSPERRHLVRANDIATIVEQKTGVPTTTITTDERSKLLALEDELHKSVIGQDEAVQEVANALRRARAELRSTKRPIATFLFLGPTGVGKTELAKTIARVYFGGENRMIRLDMSEYQDPTSVYRLIGQPSIQGTGMLTEAVLKQPFSLLLLDELEKAHSDVLNIFLQVFDDGRLTDSVGRVIDFTNTIIIATSNAGTAFVEAERKKGTDPALVRDQLVRGALQQYYRPEFLNRFDGIVLFKSLTLADIKQVAGIMIARIQKDLEQKGILLEVTDGALNFLAEKGFDPEFGARPMRRAIQDYVENQIAELLLRGDVARRDTIILQDNARAIVKKY